MKIKIKYFDGTQKLVKQKNGDWVDLSIYRGKTVKKGGYYKLSLGVAMSLPNGYEAIIAPRSSTFEKWGLIQTNSIGVVDNSYSGPDDEWKMAVYATKDIKIPAHTRLCQFRIQQKMPPVTFIESDLSNNRNRGGFGSTG